MDFKLGTLLYLSQTGRIASAFSPQSQNSHQQDLQSRVTRSSRDLRSPALYRLNYKSLDDLETIRPSVWGNFALRSMEGLSRPFGVDWPGDDVIKDEALLAKLQTLCNAFDPSPSWNQQLCQRLRYVVDEKFHGVSNDDWWSVANQESAMKFLTLRVDGIESVPANAWSALDPADRLEKMIKQFVNVAYDTVEKTMGRPPNTVADIGCGTGATARVLHSVGMERSYHLSSNGQFQVYGIDPIKKMLAYFAHEEDYSENDLLNDRTQIRLRLGALEQMPFEKNSIDVATLYAVSHELPTSALIEGLNHMFSKLSPGGVLMIVDLNPDLGLPALLKNQSPQWTDQVLKVLVLEPFIGQYLRRDECELALQAGFESAETMQTLGSNRILMLQKSAGEPMT